MSQPSKRVVLITGGASGIGNCVAKAFLDAGDAVHVCDVSQQNIDAFLSKRADASATLADVSRPADADKVLADVDSRYGSLNVLINNAGVAGPTAAVQNVTDDDWDRCIAVNLNGVFYMTRRAVPRLLKAENSAIINIASTAGLFGYPLRSPYAASKWALIGLTKTWAMELGPSDIRVNAICPGGVEGERIDAVIRRDADERGVSAGQVRDTYLKQTSMRTFVSTDDIAAMALFLASEQAHRISGQAISIDGHTEGLSNALG